MQITIRRDDLLRPISLVAGVVERRQTLPILSYVKLRQSEEQLTLTGTDLEIEISVQAQASAGNAELTVPARKLLDICRALPEGTELMFSKQGEKVAVKAGKSRFTLVTLPASDFPSIDTTEWEQALTIGQRELKQLIERTQFCMAQQDVRYYLNGLCLELGPKHLRAVATDGHRMAVSELSIATDKERQVIVPRKGIHEMARLLADTADEATLRLGTNHLRLEASGVVFTCKLIDGRFPDYTKVLPASSSKKLVLDRAMFREALARVAILSNEKYRGVRLSVQPGGLSISAHNPEQEEAVEELELNYQGEGLEIGFNVNYLSDAVSAIDNDELVLGLNDPNSSCLVTAAGNNATRYVIMPMRL